MTDHIWVFPFYFFLFYFILFFYISSGDPGQVFHPSMSISQVILETDKRNFVLLKSSAKCLAQSLGKRNVIIIPMMVLKY